MTIYRPELDAMIFSIDMTYSIESRRSLTVLESKWI